MGWGCCSDWCWTRWAGWWRAPVRVLQATRSGLQGGLGATRGPGCTVMPHSWPDRPFHCSQAGYTNLVGLKGGFYAWFRVFDNKGGRRRSGEYAEQARERGARSRGPPVGRRCGGGHRAPLPAARALGGRGGLLPGGACPRVLPRPGSFPPSLPARQTACQDCPARAARARHPRPPAAHARRRGGLLPSIHTSRRLLPWALPSPARSTRTTATRAASTPRARASTAWTRSSSGCPPASEQAAAPLPRAPPAACDSGGRGRPGGAPPCRPALPPFIPLSFCLASPSCRLALPALH